MDKQPFARIGTIVLLIAVAVAMFVLPGTFRVNMVVSIGVLTANAITTAAFIVGVLSGAAAVVILTLSVRRAYMLQHAAEQAALEAKQWVDLPKRDETNPDVLVPMLDRIAGRYPEVGPLIKITLEQVTSIRQSLAKISDIFETNAGMISQDSRFASCERLIEMVLQEIGPSLVRIVYQAHEHDGSETFVPDLARVVNKVNKVNQPHVDETRELANSVVLASTQGDTDSVLSQVQAATDVLTNPRKEGSQWGITGN